MSSEIEIAGIKISGLDWDATPESVKAVVVALSEELEGEDVEVYRHQIVEIPNL